MILAVLLTPGSDAETGVGVARFVRAADDPTVAEAAIAVSDEMQHKGLGRQLTLTLARAARALEARRALYDEEAG